MHKFLGHRGWMRLECWNGMAQEVNEKQPYIQDGFEQKFRDAGVTSMVSKK